ncbi:Structural maintenance of chromosomes protein 4 [Tetrabaena socialis]|uniref:Structural maintenance of chromosomes protein 4 n=1 Tax=Tetrabaena socialis TaxID=47790 RepID=A0A2J8A692_9CHLO|nr:Structural maintenance of chromosomes protein 4 [Tetrabaena socialis]|eukprot:PNH08015.1 Structural maintenance of chromosomes protein 4 [Tetrabaena socialis]
MAPNAEAPAVKQRLMIREMVLDNFKSYAGKQKVGPFHKSFSAVVGPNGSGKSNVIDAMLFVFGRRAKQLRFNKVSELIHNSQNHQNLEYARVTVHFQEIFDQESDEYMVVPGSEFTVARTAQRNNESHYYINDRKVSTKEVTELLKAKGIDLDNNRFLILQGEVEQISMMKPKAEDKNDTGLLEYLEDIIGTDKYVQPIEEASKKLEEMNEKRGSMISRLKVSEKEKDGLQGKAEEAQQFLDKQSEMLRSRINATHVFAMKVQANLDTAEASSRELKEKLAHERSKFKEHEKELAAAEKRHTAADKAHAANVKAVEAAVEAFKAMERKDVQNNETVKALKAKLKKASDKLTADIKLMEKTEGDKIDCEVAVPQLAKQAEAWGAELKAAEEALEGLQEAIKGEVEGYHQQLSAVRKELAPWEKKQGEVQARISVGQREIELLQRQQLEAQKRLDGANKELEEARKAAVSKQQEIKELEAAVEACRRGAEAHKQALAAAQTAERQAEEQLGAVRERVGQLRGDLSSSQGQSGVMKELMAAKARGELTGIHGRLGCPRLFDLVKLKDPRLRAAFFYACGNTLVAGDLEQASRIAYGGDRRFRRVVTLQGQLIADSGTMSGGGKPLTGRMALGSAAPRGNAATDARAAEAELREAEGKAEQLAQALQAARDAAVEAQRAVRLAERELASLELRLPKGPCAECAGPRQARRGEKLRSLKTKVDRTRKKIEEAETEMSKKEVQVKAHGKAMEKLKKDITKQGKDRAKLEEEVEACAEATKSIEDEAIQIKGRQQEAEGRGEATGAALEEARSKASAALCAHGPHVTHRMVPTYAPTAAPPDPSTRTLMSLSSSCDDGYMVDEAALRGSTSDAKLIELAEQLVLKATMLEAELQKLNPDLSAIPEFKAKAAEHAARAKELDDATAARDTVRKEYEALRKLRLDGFMAGFEHISLRLKEVYQMITCGGDAELELVDSLDPFSEGIIFSVRPPKKSWKNISNLSGGEKTLSSLSLVFALHTYKPNPLYVMDEIDAALDFKNVSIVGHYIKERTAGAQFVIISLRNNMFELAERLVGIFKTDNATQTVAVNPGSFAVMQQQQQAAEQGAQAGRAMQQGCGGQQQPLQAIA